MRNNPFNTYRRLTLQERLLFYERLALYLRSGIPIARSLTFIRDTATSHASPIFSSILTSSLEGQSLSKTLSEHPRSFPLFDIHLVELGEYGGTLAETLDRLAERIQRKRELKRTVLNALLYPFIIAIGTITVSGFLLAFTLPKILPVFKSMHMSLPPITRWLISFSDFLATSWIAILVGTVLTVGGFMWGMRYTPFRAYLSRAALRIPLVGSLLRSYHVASNLGTLAMLLRSGIPVVPALVFCAKSARSIPFRNAILASEVTVREGNPLSKGFAASPHLFPREALQLIAAGEETGTLPASLQTAADLFERECREQSRTLTTLIEPVMMIAMGAIVGFIAIAIISPIYSITQNLHTPSL